MSSPHVDIAIIGGGPAGLRAAEVAASGGARVTVFDAKASVGRKFLVAGKGGLNLTKEEALPVFAARYSSPDQPAGIWNSLLDAFGPDELRQWAADLGVETFVASSGRVYPRELKAAPLLRRWLQRLRSGGVRFAMHHRLADLELMKNGSVRLYFQINGGMSEIEATSVILAMGGGSWPETGSDGAWVNLVSKLGISVGPLQPANCGWEVDWPQSVLLLAEGKPLKNICGSVGSTEAVGELLVTRYGLEGGVIYQLGPALRATAEPALSIDLKPSFTVDQLTAKLGPVRRNYLAEARMRWKLSDAAFAVLSFCTGDIPPASGAALAELCKNCIVRLKGPRPLAEAISSAGGIQWREVDENLMLRALPGVFAAGEMIDWEAPTGGYLLQGCFATGTRAGRAALEYSSRLTGTFPSQRCLL